MAKKDDRSIARTAAVLDQIKPGWYKEVTEPLIMFDPRMCVLGQVFRKEARRADPYSTGYWWANSQEFALELSKATPYGGFWDQRTAPKWNKEIEVRRNGVPASRLRRVFGRLSNKFFRLAA